MTSIRDLARRIDVLERDRIQRKRPTLSFSSIDGGALQANDHDGALTMVIGRQFDGTNAPAVVAGPTPPTPAVPLVTETLGGLRIYWDGTFEDGAVAPMDFARVIAYAVPSDSYTSPAPLNQAIMVGAFSSATGGEIFASLDPDAEYVVYLVTWTQAGKYGPASAIDFGTPAVQAPPTAPPAATTLTAVGLPDSFVLRSGDLAPGTFVTYQVSRDSGATWESLGNPIASSITVAKSSIEGGGFLLETDYQFRALTSNAFGPQATPSNISTARLDTSKTAQVASEIVTASLSAGHALLGLVEVGGRSFTLSPPGVDPENPAGGLLILTSSGGRIHLPADGSAPSMTGLSDVEVQNLNAKNLDVLGASRITGSFTMGAVIADPVTKPTVAKNYHEVTPDESLTNVWGLCRNVADTGWIYTVGSYNAVYQMLDDGTVTHAWAPEDNPDLNVDRIYGVTRVGSAYYMLALTWYNDGSGSSSYFRTLIEFDAAWNDTDFMDIDGGYTGDPRPVIGASDTGQIIIASISGDNTVMRRYDVSGNYVTQVTLAGVGAALGGIAHGDADFGAARYVLQQRDADPKVYSLNVLQPSEAWPRHNSSIQQRGLWWDGTHFWTVTSSGHVVRYETAASAPAATYYLSYDWRDSDTHHTSPSPEATFVRPKRARIKSTAIVAPQVGTSGAHVADRVQHYVATSSGGTKYPQGSPLVAGERVTILTTVATGTTPVASASNMAEVAVAGYVGASVGGFMIDGNSNGTPGNGTFRSAIDTVPAGRAMRNTAQSMVFESSTDILWNQAVFLRDGMTYSASGLIVPKAGLYEATAQVGLATDNAAGGIMHIVLTGATWTGAVVLERGDCATSGSITLQGGSTLVRCSAGDALSVSVYHTNGANRNLQLGSYETSISAVYRGPYS